MPLLVSPIDGKTPMQQIVRDGIEIDRCPVSGGIWLDAGELEKLLNRLNKDYMDDREEYHRYRQAHPQAPHGYAPPPHGYHGKPYKYDDDYDRYHHKKYGHKSKIKTIMDLFG
jgi:Zn-finger nucleic acid-binding protein